MRRIYKEDISSYFSSPMMRLTKCDLVDMSVKSVKLKRNKKLDLILTAVAEGAVDPSRPAYRAGTVRQPTETIEFDFAHGNGKGVARGVVYHGNSIHHVVATGAAETTLTFSLNSLELNFNTDRPPAYVVDWVDNVSDGFIWPDFTRDSEIETFTREIGSGNSKLTIFRKTEGGGGSKALHLTVDGTDLYLLSSGRRKKGKNEGEIIYRGAPSEESRKKIRNCLSFILGLPFVYKGSTVYSDDWHPISMRSVDAFTAGGGVYNLHDLPPYPINNPRYLNILDKGVLSYILVALLRHYDDLKFNELVWSYWYAMCAPVHMSAAYFGALIEQLQKNAGSKLKKTRTAILDDNSWKTLKSGLQSLMDDLDIAQDLRPVINNKLSNLNQVPQNVALKRLFESMGLSISEVEVKAWKQRNDAAHGTISKHPDDVILHTKVLRILFHRMLAGITYCSDRYIDYFNYDFPIRPIGEGVPPRN